MAINITMPALSPTMEEGTLARWTVKEGDTVSAGDIIAEIETDKATMEVEAVDEGIVGKLLVSEGTEGVKVNDLIAVLLEEGESAGDLETEPQHPPSRDENAASVATDDGRPTAPSEDASKPVAPSPAPRAQGERVFASPLARVIAARKGIDLAAIRGSGPRGRIVKADVEKLEAAEEPVSEAAAMRPAAAPLSPAPDAAEVKKIYGDRPYEEVRLDGMRRIIAARLTEAKQTVPHFYLRRDITLDALLGLRKQINAELEARGVTLSINDFIIKASALALQQVPDCNAVWAGDRVLKFEASDVAVAVAVDGGLFTPVLRDAEAKTLSALSLEMKDLANRARQRKLAPEEYQGGAFAVSNLGMMGIDSFDAIINPPHAAILAVGAGGRRPVVASDGQIVASTVMSVTLSVDHRVIDGALGAEFLAHLARLLEHPIAMLA